MKQSTWDLFRSPGSTFAGAQSNQINLQFNLNKCNPVTQGKNKRRFKQITPKH